MLLALHAPDGLFSLPVNLVFAVIVGFVLAVAGTVLSRRRDHRLVPLMGIMAAFVFAGQMVNFPISSGTTGHLLGGTLAAVLLGPWAGTVVMAAVVSFQALLGDGGLTVLGPNIFNMGIVGTCVAYFVYRAALGRGEPPAARVVAASCFAAWIAVVLASVFASLQLAASGTATLGRALPAMLVIHALIGAGEGLITAAVVAFVLKTRPELVRGVRPAPDERPLGRPAVAVGLAVSLTVAAFMSLLPTLWDHPDGLEFVGHQQGFLAEEPQHDPDGRLTSLPAYPLGVRLAVVDGRVTAVHRYEPGDGGVAVGDVLEQIDGRRVTCLEDATAALPLEPPDQHSGATNAVLLVRVSRAGQARELRLRAAGAPGAGAAPPLVALLPDYTVPGVSGWLSTSLAGAVGTVVMFVLSLGVGRLLVRPSRLARAVGPAAPSESGRA